MTGEPGHSAKYLSKTQTSVFLTDISFFITAVTSLFSYYSTLTMFKRAKSEDMTNASYLWIFSSGNTLITSSEITSSAYSLLPGAIGKFFLF